MLSEASGDWTPVLRSESPLVTSQAGKLLASCLEAGDGIGLVGNLGAGKTLLVAAVAEGLNVPVPTTSPTFTLVNEYPGGRIPLFHADLYRLESQSELDEIGLDELYRGGQGVLLVEWSDKFPVLYGDHLSIRLEVSGAQERLLSLCSNGERSHQLARVWKKSLSEELSCSIL